MQLTQAISKWADVVYPSSVGSASESGTQGCPYGHFHPSGWQETYDGGSSGPNRQGIRRDGKLLDVTGTVRYEIIGKGTASRAAEALHQQAREAGGRGEYEKAIALLERASELAPEWPYPVYDERSPIC